MQPKLPTFTRWLQRWWLLPATTLLFFALGIKLFFPDATLQQRLQHELTAMMHQPVEVGQITFQLPANISLSELATTLPDYNQLHFSAINISPAWRQLLTATAAVDITGKLLGGSIKATLNSNRRWQLNAARLHIDTSIAQLPSIHITTSLDQLQLTVLTPSPAKLEHLQTHLQLSQLRLGGLKQLGSTLDTLHLGTVSMKLSQKHQRIFIDQLRCDKGDLDITAKGYIDLRSNLQYSRINLTLTITPQPTTPAQLTSMLPLFAKQTNTGSFTVNISGTLQQPEVNF